MKPFETPPFLGNLTQNANNTAENASGYSNSPDLSIQRKVSFITSPTKRASTLNNTISEGLTN